jgi:hypothetical protein
MCSELPELLDCEGNPLDSEGEVLGFEGLSARISFKASKVGNIHIGLRKRIKHNDLGKVPIRWMAGLGWARISST